MSTKSLCHLRFVVCSLVLLGWARPLFATTVALVRPPSASLTVTETLSRVHGELLSVGLDVTTVERPAADLSRGIDSRTWLQQVANERGAAAVIDILGNDQSAAVDVWVVKSPPGRFEVTRVVAEPDATNVPERLALHAIEALRASLLEIEVAGRQAHPESVAQPQSATVQLAGAPAPQARLERWAIEAGALATGGFDGAGLAVLPVLRLVWAMGSSAELTADLAGSGTRSSISAAAGSAKVAEQYGLLGACYRWRSQQRLWPFVSLSAGVLRTSVDGQSSSPARGHTIDQWSLLLDGSVGAAARIYHRFYVATAAHVQVAEPYVAIHIVDSVAATIGRPNIVLTLTLGAWL